MVGSNGQLLANLLYEPSQEDPISKHLFTTATVSGLVSADMMYPQVGQSLDGPSFCLWIISSPCSFAQEHFWVTNFEMS